jgi:membrane fusion protein (multidrug efflux system)
VTPLVSGRISEICKCEGVEVAAGDVLARLDDREESALLEELQAREAFLREELDRQAQLLAQQVTTTQSFSRAQSEHAQARAALAAVRERLEYHVLRAPLDGTVLRRDGEIGEVVAPGDILFWVGRPRPIWVVAEVDEEDIPLIVLGQASFVGADAFPGRVFEGRVDQITPLGDPVTKSYRVRIAMPDEVPLMIGMTTEVNIEIDRVEDALLVPATALVGDAVFVVADGRVWRRAVETGLRGSREVEIVGGLEEGEAVVARPSTELVDGARVAVADTAP